MHIIDELQSTLEETSRDGEILMINSKLMVCAFDKVKERYVGETIPYVDPNPKSNDALYFADDVCYFIEFKNGKINNTVNYEIIKKIYDSLFILFDLKYPDKKGNVVDSISYTRANMIYILVYNEENYIKMGPTRQTTEGIERQEGRSVSKHRDKLYRTVRGLAGEELVLFGLDQFRTYFFKVVHTYTTEEFYKKFPACQGA